MVAETCAGKQGRNLFMKTSSLAQSILDQLLFNSFLGGGGRHVTPSKAGT